MEHVSPVGVDEDTESTTVPVNPLTAVKVIVEKPDTPGPFWLGLTEPAETVKSVTAYVNTVVWVPAEPLVPVTVTVYVPMGPLHASVEVPVPPVMLGGLREQNSPLEDK